METDFKIKIYLFTIDESIIWKGFIRNIIRKFDIIYILDATDFIGSYLIVLMLLIWLKIIFYGEMLQD